MRGEGEWVNLIKHAWLSIDFEDFVFVPHSQMLYRILFNGGVWVPHSASSTKTCDSSSMAPSFSPSLSIVNFLFLHPILNGKVSHEFSMELNSIWWNLGRPPNVKPTLPLMRTNSQRVLILILDRNQNTYKESENYQTINHNNKV